MSHSVFKRARKTESLLSDAEDIPAKKLKFRTIDVPDHCTFYVPSPPTHDNVSTCEEDYNSEAPPSQATDYQYSNHWLDYKTLNPDHHEMPSTLISFLVPLLTLQKDKGIIPESLKDDIKEYPEDDYTLAMLDSDSYYRPDQAESGYTRGLFDTVVKIVKAAEKCHSYQYDENGWSSLVYTPLLAAALEIFNPEPHLQYQLVDFAPCSTATIEPEWHRKSVPKGQVDFVLYVDPSREPIARQRCLARRDRVGSVNHTQFIPTAEFPIAASIKTNSRQGSSQDAEIQLAAWQAAQWHKMGIAVGGKISELGFLPGIIIDGHEWRFHATTYGLPGNKTTLWSSHILGSTTTIVGVFRILAGIRAINIWIRDTFWPWYKRHELSPKID